MPWITGPCCERCWIDRNSTQHLDGSIEVRTPVRIKDPPVESCFYCGAATIVGIYVRVEEQETSTT